MPRGGDGGRAAVESRLAAASSKSARNQNLSPAFVALRRLLRRNAGVSMISEVRDRPFRQPAFRAEGRPWRIAGGGRPKRLSCLKSPRLVGQ